MFVEKLTINDHVTFLTSTFKMGVARFDYIIPTKMFANPTSAKVVFKYKDKRITEIISFSDKKYKVLLNKSLCKKAPNLTNEKIDKMWQGFLKEKFGTKYNQYVNKEITK